MKGRKVQMQQLQVLGVKGSRFTWWGAGVGVKMGVSLTRLNNDLGSKEKERTKIIT